MKNQYFGDENDYKKYGILRKVSRFLPGGLTICWMLTPDDGTISTDNHKYVYLDKPDIWLDRDPLLFEFLLDSVGSPAKWAKRKVSLARNVPGLEKARFFTDEIPSGINGRKNYFNELQKFSAGTDLVFFDPDIGMQPQSVPNVKTRSAAHLYWDELRLFYARHNHSVLIYQHRWRSIKHEKLIDITVEKIFRCLQVRRIFSLKTSNVTFFLVPQPRHIKHFENAVSEIRLSWDDRITIRTHQGSM